MESPRGSGNLILKPGHNTHLALGALGAPAAAAPLTPLHLSLVLSSERAPHPMPPRTP